MRSKEFFYELKTLTLKEIEKSFYLKFDTLEQYLQNYQRMYLLCDLLEEKKKTYYQKIILENIYILIESYKNKFCYLEQESNSSVFLDTIKLKKYLLSLKKQYSIFQEVIVIDDI